MSFSLLDAAMLGFFEQTKSISCDTEGTAGGKRKARYCLGMRFLVSI